MLLLHAMWIGVSAITQIRKNKQIVNVHKFHTQLSFAYHYVLVGAEVVMHTSRIDGLSFGTPRANTRGKSEEHVLITATQSCSHKQLHE